MLSRDAESRSRQRRRAPWSSLFPRRPASLWLAGADTFSRLLGRGWSWATACRARRWSGYWRRCARAEPPSDGTRVRGGRPARHARLVRRPRRCRPAPRARSRGRAPLPLPEQASAAREGVVVRRLGLVPTREAPRGWELPASPSGRQQGAGLDRRVHVRLHPRRDRLHGSAARVVPPASFRKDAKGDRHGSPSMISTRL